MTLVAEANKMTTLPQLVGASTWIAAGVDISLKVTLLLTATAILTGLLRSSSAASRHYLWSLAFCGVLAMPLLPFVLPAWKLAILPAEDATTTVIVRSDRTPHQAIPISNPVAVNNRPERPPLPAPPPTVTPSTESVPLPGNPNPIEQLVLAIWSIGFAAACLPFLIAVIKKRRLWRHVRPADDLLWKQHLEDAQRKLGLRRPVRLLVSQRELMPMACGILRANIVLPASSSQWSTQRRRIVLLHELAHIARYDLPLQLVARFASTLFWFNPLAWYGLVRLGVERERACDDCVVRAGERASDYASELLSIAKSHFNQRMVGAVAMARTSRLEDRLNSLFDSHRSHQMMTRRWVCGLFVAASTFISFMAAARPIPGQPQTSKPIPAANTAEKSPPKVATTPPQVPGQLPPVQPVGPIDPTEVRRRIAGLATTDQTVPFDQQNSYWLAIRRDQIVPELIAGMNDKNPKIAGDCFSILQQVQATPQLIDAFIAKAREKDGPLRVPALNELQKRPITDPRVKQVFREASEDTSLIDINRANWAWLAGDREAALKILAPIMLQNKIVQYKNSNLFDQHFARTLAIGLLGEIGGAASIDLLLPITNGDEWLQAVAARRSLAQIDPTKYGLTKDQQTFLETARGFKEDQESFDRRMNLLAKLPVQEVRPFVILMLRDRNFQREALWLLSAWKDKDALPQILALIEPQQHVSRNQSVSAYLSIDDSGKAEQEILALLNRSDGVTNESTLDGIVSAKIPSERKLRMLRAARLKLPASQPLATVLHRQIHQHPEWIGEIVLPLAEEEQSLPALVSYLGFAGTDRDKLLVPQVQRAMTLLLNDPTIAAGGEKVTASTASAADMILIAAATYDLQDLAPQIQQLMQSKNVNIRAAAQRAAAKLRMPGTMADLYAQFGSNDPHVRERAAQLLSELKPLDETERAAREEAILRYLGTPSEDFAMRALVNCGQNRAVKALESILDDSDPRRAVYAAWVLAQLPDEEAANRALRRVAIFAMFYHQGYQQGSGIDFKIAPRLAFHQVTSNLNASLRASTTRQGPVSIPPALLQPFALDDREQLFAVRSYRLSETEDDHSGLRMPIFYLELLPQQQPKGMDPSYLPLLKEIAQTDSHVKALLVAGTSVAHFNYRQIAAKKIQATTSAPATYRGLAGEEIDSNSFPKPYPDQDTRLAKNFVDRVEKTLPPLLLSKKPVERDEWGNPKVRTDPTGEQWERIGLLQRRANRFRDDFGTQVLDAIRAEADRREINVTRILPAAES